MKVYYRKGDITGYRFYPSSDTIDELQTAQGAIVNAANEGLMPGGGVCGAIFGAIRNSGDDNYRQVMDEIDAMPTIGGMRSFGGMMFQSNDKCKVGDAKVTSAAGLASDYIFHAVAPTGHSHSNLQKQYAAVYSCFMRCLQLGEENKVGGIGFNFIGTGIFGCDKKVVKTAFEMACADFNKTNPKYVEEAVMYVFLTVDLQYFEHLPVKKMPAELETENKAAGIITRFIQRYMNSLKEDHVVKYRAHHSIVKKKNFRMKKNALYTWMEMTIRWQQEKLERKMEELKAKRVKKTKAQETKETKEVAGLTAHL